MLEDLVEHEHEFEEIRGVPGHLPADERVLWQGAPNWKSIAFRVFHVRLIFIYFGLIAAWRIMAGLHDGIATPYIVASVVTAIVMGLMAIALLCGIAWIVERTTVYTITNKRILMRIGMALTLTLNLPFSKIAAAAVKPFGGKAGTGNISLSVAGNKRLAWMVLWPHTRPWKFAQAEPTLRCIDDVEGVADILATALERSIARQRPKGMDGLSSIEGKEDEEKLSDMVAAE